MGDNDYISGIYSNYTDCNRSRGWNCGAYCPLLNDAGEHLGSKSMRSDWVYDKAENWIGMSCWDLGINACFNLCRANLYNQDTEKAVAAE